MTVEEIKNELKHMDDPVLKEITSFILKLRSQQDPDHPNKISDLLDSSNSKWMPIDDMEKLLGEE